jgi:hypothetical protein
MEQHVEDAKPWVKPLARMGYSARGVVYLIIGGLAFLAAIGSGGGQTDTEGAVQTLLNQPFGTFLLWVLVVGLAGYVLWRLIQSFMDTDNHGLDAKGLAVRAGLLASAITYTTLLLYTLSLIGVFSSGGSSGGSGPVRDTIAGFIGSHYVSLLLAIVFLGVAIAHWIKAYKEKYAKYFKADPQTMRYIHPVSKIGLTAQGIVLAVIALLLFYRFQSADGGAG